MYGLPHAGILDQEVLGKRLNAKGYRKSTLPPGLWTHAGRPISFTLCLDDLGVYMSAKNVLTTSSKRSMKTTPSPYIGKVQDTSA